MEAGPPTEKFQSLRNTWPEKPEALPWHVYSSHPVLWPKVMIETGASGAVRPLQTLAWYERMSHGGCLF
jgi:hypothetical protein